MQLPCHGRKNLRGADSYDIIYLSTCYIQLLFRWYYSIGSSVDYQGSVRFRRFSFNTVFAALAHQQN